MQKTVEMSLEGKTSKNIIYDSEKNDPRGSSSAPHFGYIQVYGHNLIKVQQNYWYISQISGERLLEHWSSGYDLV